MPDKKRVVINVDAGTNEDWIKTLGPDVGVDGKPIEPKRDGKPWVKPQPPKAAGE